MLCLAGCSKASFRGDRDMYDSPDNQAIPAEEYDAIVTVKRSPTDTLYFQLDDNTRLFPQNYQKARGLEMLRNEIRQEASGNV